MPWTTEWAPTREELNACVECGLCLPHCPTFRLTGDETASPRGRLNAMSAVAAGDMPVDAAFDEVMSFCLQCRACEAACPSLVPFGRAMEGARAELAAARPQGRRLRRRVLGSWLGRRWMVGLATFFAALGQRIGARHWAPRVLRRGLSGVRRLPFRRRRITGRSFGEDDGRETVGLLAGCVMEPWFAGVHEATIGLLTAAGYRVVVPEGQTCCGALAAHEGAADEAARLAAVNTAAFAGVDLVVSNAAGCSAHLASYGHWAEEGDAIEGKASDALHVIDRAIGDGRLPRLPSGRGVVAIQDPCHHRHALRMTAEPRRILRAAGYEVREVDPSGMCCGAAGVYSLLRPDTADALGRRKADQIAATGTDLVASANPGCEIQLRSHLANSVRVAHPLELYWEAMRDSR
ncbi:MAG TPA: (Fe-S)-binding protein [Acidimicrobiia bacterium]|nr:(Fe-S)-binding protein [Acidimicrobiia bacterium]